MLTTDIDVETYERDGVVVLRRAVDAHGLEQLARGVERNRLQPSPWAFQYTEPGATVGFWTDYVTWQDIPEYRDVVFDGHLAALARRLMRSTTSRFFHEHVLVKEAGTRERTPWHHDQPYYCVNGDQNVSMWISLDPVPRPTGMEFVAGSHRWDRWFVPRRFVDNVSYADAGDGFELVPDIDAERERHRIVSFDIEPGDVIAFHFRVLHDAPGTEALTHGRRAVSFRWLGDDATFALRPWLHSPPFESRSLTIGGPLDDDRFPLVD
jgi:ectoine hydroxylase-related dioxygenase (phytanoyl-CoA dioxygenase family)